MLTGNYPKVVKKSTTNRPEDFPDKIFPTRFLPDKMFPDKMFPTRFCPSRFPQQDFVRQDVSDNMLSDKLSTRQDVSVFFFVDRVRLALFWGVGAEKLAP